MTRITVHFDLNPDRAPLLLEVLRNLDLGPDGRAQIIPDAFDPARKMTADEFFALSQDDRFRYYDAHGGEFRVMQEMGLGFTDEQMKLWNVFQREQDAEWDAEYKRRHGGGIPD